MVKVSNNHISMTRGDTYSFVVNVKTATGEPYVLGQGETLHFNLRKDIDSTEDILHKQFQGNVLSFTQDDTLNIDYGVYVYDVTLRTNNGEFYTIVASSPFKLTGEVHTYVL